MSSVFHINKVLEKNSGILEKLWLGEITRIDESGKDKAVADLLSIHAIMVDGEGNIRLARGYREFLARVLGARGRYGASRSIADDLNRLKAAADDAAEATTRGEDEACYQALAEGIDIIWELADTIEASTVSFERILHEGIGEGGSRAARLRRMEFYRERISGLREGLQMLSGPARDAISHPSCRDLLREWTRMIGKNLAATVQRLQRASDEINRLIILDQNVMAETRRTRAILRALKTMDEDERVEVLSLDRDFPILAGVTWNILVDPRDPDLEDMRERVAQTLGPVERKPRRKVVEEADTPLPDDEYLEEEPIVDDTLVGKFYAALKDGERLSVRDWVTLNATPDDNQMLISEEIMTGIITDSGRYDIEFIPPLSAYTSSRIRDMNVQVAP